MSSIATVTSKGQVTLPAAVRRALSLHAGAKLEFTVAGDHVVVRPAPDFLSLAGSIEVPAEIRGAAWRDVKAMAYRERGAA